MPRVMIVEDDPTILSNLSQILQISGVDVIEAHDGQVAWDLLKSDPSSDGAGLPKMIVSDLMMPNMDGFDLLRAVRADSDLKALPFVLLSARSDVSDLQQAFLLGANDYLVKPFDVDHLIDVIRFHMTVKVAGSEGALAGKGYREDSDFYLE